jgi:hypothetical protein
MTGAEEEVAARAMWRDAMGQMGLEPDQPSSESAVTDAGSDGQGSQGHQNSASNSAWSGVVTF